MTPRLPPATSSRRLDLIGLITRLEFTRVGAFNENDGPEWLFEPDEQDLICTTVKLRDN